MPSGKVRDLRTGRLVAEGVDVEQAFLDAVSAEAAAGPCYVVVGTGSPTAFVERVRALAPVVEDAAIGDRALIFSGYPSEWSGA